MKYVKRFIKYFFGTLGVVRLLPGASCGTADLENKDRTYLINVLA